MIIRFAKQIFPRSKHIQTPLKFLPMLSFQLSLCPAACPLPFTSSIPPFTLHFILFLFKWLDCNKQFSFTHTNTHRHTSMHQSPNCIRYWLASSKKDKGSVRGAIPQLACRDLTDPAEISRSDCHYNVADNQVIGSLCAGLETLKKKLTSQWNSDFSKKGCRSKRTHL